MQIESIEGYHQMPLPGYHRLLKRRTPFLVEEEIQKIERWKLQYTLESAGFTSIQAKELLSLQWEYQNRFIKDPLDSIPSPITIRSLFDQYSLPNFE